jgi:hypothetical protein
LIDTEYELDDRKIKVKFPTHSGVLSTGGRGTKVNAKLDTGDYLTDFAIRFVKACRAPNTIDGVGRTIRNAGPTAKKLPHSTKSRMP